MQSLDPVFVPAGRGQQLKILGSVHTNKVIPEQTGGAFTALEISIPPGMGPPMHTHDTDCEFFYVLEGEITFSHPGGSLVGKAGDFCFLPKGGYHAFRNEGETDARALVVVAPGIKAHQFFDEVDEKLGGAIDEPVVFGLATQNGISFAV